MNCWRPVWRVKAEDRNPQCKHGKLDRDWLPGAVRVHPSTCTPVPCTLPVCLVHSFIATSLPSVPIMVIRSAIEVVPAQQIKSHRETFCEHAAPCRLLSLPTGASSPSTSPFSKSLLKLFHQSYVFTFLLSFLFSLFLLCLTLTLFLFPSCLWSHMQKCVFLCHFPELMKIHRALSNSSPVTSLLNSP